MIDVTNPPCEIAWEIRAPGWPPSSKGITVLGGLALTGAALVSLGGGTLTNALAGFTGWTWPVPPLLPILILLGLVQAYRVARWRSTAWALSGDGATALRARGVFYTSITRVPVEALSEDFFRGLAPDSAGALLRDCQAGLVPSREVGASGTWKGLFGLFLVALVLTPLVEGFAWGHRTYEADFSRISAAANQALAKAQARTEAQLLQGFAQRVAQEASLSPQERQEELTRWGSFLSHEGSSALRVSDRIGGSLERLEVVIATSTVGSSDPSRPDWRGRDERVNLRFELVRPGLLPRPVLPLAILEGAQAPENQLFLDNLLPLLEAAGVPYQRVVADR